MNDAVTDEHSEDQVTRAGCVYCSGGPLTREELWPDWASKELGALGGWQPTDSHMINVQVGEFSIKRETKTRPIGKVRRFCKNCNTGWMSGLEKATGPILTPAIWDKPVRMTPGRQRIVSRWAMNRALVTDLHRQPYEANNSIPAYFKHFFETRDLYPTAQVVMARYVGSRIGNIWNVGFSHDIRRSPDERLTRVGKPKQHSYRTDGYLVTLQYGTIVVQILLYPEGTKNPFLLRGDLFIPDYTLQIWPPRGRPRWPPKKSFTDESALNEFAGERITERIDRLPPPTPKAT